MLKEKGCSKVLLPSIHVSFAQFIYLPLIRQLMLIFMYTTPFIYAAQTQIYVPAVLYKHVQDKILTVFQKTKN